FHESWERLKDLIRKCPHHAVPKWQLVQCFYDGLTAQNRQMVDASCGGQLADMMRKREESHLPSQVVRNLRNQTGQCSYVEQAQAIATLRSGRVIEGTQETISNPNSIHEKSPEESVSSKSGEKETVGQSEMEVTKASTFKENEQKGKEKDITFATPKAPFPECLRSPSLVPPFGKKLARMDEMMELFKQVQINIPLLDAIRQVPAYAKFLKDLCTTKRKLETHIPKTVHLTEQVNAVLSNKLPPKLKDPGAPLISCKIGNLLIDRALSDLGASVNILPSSVYDHFGVGKLKPTEVTLQLADRSLKILKGFIEDVLVKVDELYFPVDFLVLDMETPAIGKPHSINLGCPFLATANACINCRSGAMDISFGNEKLKINIFNAPLGLQGEDACFAIDRVDRTYPWSFVDDNCEVDSDTVEINAPLDSPLIHSTPDWIDTQWLKNEAELAWLENKLNEPTSSSEWDHLSHYIHKIATPDQTSFDIEFDSNFLECLKEIEDEESIQHEFLKWLDNGVIESISDRERKFDEIISECMREFEEIEKRDFFEVLGPQPLESEGPLPTSWHKPFIEKFLKFELKEFPCNSFMGHCSTSFEIVNVLWDWETSNLVDSFLDCFYWWNSCWDCSYIVKVVFSHCVDALKCYGSIDVFYWWKYFWDVIYIVQTMLSPGIFEFTWTGFKDTFNVHGPRSKPYVDGINDGQIIESVDLIDPVYAPL
ncbi:hypothetical protein CFOL_v3_04341, partial [Cephalotus follicularis]